ncbi:uridine diphosphate glucose pyrophosphatase NUDT14 isoform X2 [Hypanus sabinus]|uniref:uridine diphosphate glucose pyrophosphatase NUDT14 isoform X2 n=1 Tax=Hypanus sabinus TaxID=79690 RepID=UPI0028C439D0|nr:uridine diphosphate glucose pyrophosphatase NUDT14 isoform X2 [Hypanus sabinus]
MESLSEVEIGPCRNSRFLRPLRLHYTQNGVRKEWDFMKTHDSCCVRPREALGDVYAEELKAVRLLNPRSIDVNRG